MKNFEARVNGAGPYLRVVTPVLCVFITVIVTIMLYNITSISDKVHEMDSHFTNHLMHHQQLEVGYADRLAKIEGNRFTSHDGDILEARIEERHDAAYPPKWLVDKVNSNALGLERTKRLLRELEIR